MTPTLLELVIAIIVIVTAWQLGLALAPSILRWWNAMPSELDHVVDEARDEPATPTSETAITKENHHGT